MTGEQLKKSILKHAIEGKLCKQDPADEPADALLERIRKEKRKLLKEGKIKKYAESRIYRGEDGKWRERVEAIFAAIDSASASTEDAGQAQKLLASP